MAETILMTGATGFLGSNLLKRLLVRNYDIIILKRSFSNPFRIKEELSSVQHYDIDRTELQSVFAKHRIDIIMHCATSYGRRDNRPMEIIDANLILPLKLLQMGVDNGTSHFINTDTLLDKRINNYSLSKKHFLDWLMTYSNRIKCVNVKIEHFYGYQDDESKFVTMIIKKLLNNVENIELTKGEQKRDFIYIDDVVAAFELIIDNLKNMKDEFVEFEIGRGANISIRELCELIQKITNNQSTKLNFGAIPYRQNEVMESRVDISSLISLGWRPKYSIQEGLMKTIEKERAEKR